MKSGSNCSFLVRTCSDSKLQVFAKSLDASISSLRNEVVLYFQDVFFIHCYHDYEQVQIFPS